MVSMASVSICCMEATETAWRACEAPGGVFGRLNEGVPGWIWGCAISSVAALRGQMRQPDYDDEVPGGVAAEVGVVSSFSLAAAFRAFILVCLIFGNPKTERPSGHRPCAIKCRTRSCRFMTLRSNPAACLADRKDE